MNINIENADSRLLFKLFKDFTDRLVHNTERLGIFAVDEKVFNNNHKYEDQAVFTDSDIKKVIKEMKK